MQSFFTLEILINKNVNLIEFSLIKECKLKLIITWDKVLDARKLY